MSISYSSCYWWTSIWPDFSTQ